MIIGNGDIATALKEGGVDRPGFCFFASGVSKSQETSMFEFARESDLMVSQDPDKHIVYFSTLSVLYGESAYIQHKLNMEKLVKKFRRYTIMRLGNITWGTNPHTLINAMRIRHKNKEPLVIRDKYRYIINLGEFLHWIKLIPNWNCEMNCPGRMMKVSEVVEEYIYD